MISGSTRGKGGRALSAHLLKAEADQTTHVIEPRGIVSRGDLHAQLAELVASARGSRTDRPCYHVHCDPPPAAPDSQAVLDAWWRAFESEFGLTGAYVGAQHIKYGRKHEHRVYSLVGDDGRIIDTRNDYARRTYVSVRVAHALGLEPAPTPHARSVAHRLLQEGRHDVVEWMSKHGLIEAEKPIAPSTPEQRLQEARTGVRLADVRAAAFDAWQASTDGPSLRRELAARGLGLAMGTAGAVIVDRSGTPHALTRVIGAASRIATGERIPAAAVRARVAGLQLEAWNGSAGFGGNPGRPDDARHPDRGAGLGRGERPVDRPRGSAGERGQSGRIPGGAGHPADLGGQRFAQAARRGFARARLRLALAGIDLRAVRSAQHLAEKMADISVARRRGEWVPGQTDIWGVPLP